MKRTGTGGSNGGLAGAGREVSYVSVSDLEEAAEDGGEAMVARAYEIADEAGVRLSGAESIHTLAVDAGRGPVEFGRVVGALATTGVMDGSMSFSVVVDPGFRGRGVGSRLVSVAVREAKELARAGLLTRLTADVINDDVMRPMLLRRGFRRSGGRWMSLDLGGHPPAPYEPDDGAPADGEWDRSGPEPRWRQEHRALVRDALRSWKGDPVNLRPHMADEVAGAPWPGSGGGKVRRQQARALLWELANGSRPSPGALYRGSHVEPIGVQSWSESRAVAARWAARNGGQVFELPRGARGLRVADYTASAFDAEREWVAYSAGWRPARARP